MPRLVSLVALSCDCGGVTWAVVCSVSVVDARALVDWLLLLGGATMGFSVVVGVCTLRCVCVRISRACLLDSASTRMATLLFATLVLIIYASISHGYPTQAKPPVKYVAEHAARVFVLETVRCSGAWGVCANFES
jgi:hypothetical protein